MMLNSIPVALHAGTLERYLQSINKIPLLSAEEEQQLARRYRDKGDVNAAKQLVMSHLRFVVKIARGYRGYGLAQSDLIQEGSIGLMKAVKRFNPDIRVRLVSFAIHWIRAEIHEYILRNWKIMKIATTKAQRKLFFNLRSSKKRLGWLSKEENDTIAKSLGVKPQEVNEMEKRLSNKDMSFDAPESEDGTLSPVSYLASQVPSPENILEVTQLKTMQFKAMSKAINKLDERSKNIISERWLNDKKQTLHQLATTYGISAERIRQLEQSAFKKILGDISGIEKL